MIKNEILGISFLDGIVFITSAIFEDQYSNILFFNTTERKFDNKALTYFNNSLEQKIELMANTQLIKLFSISAVALGYLIILLYYLDSYEFDYYAIELNYKKFFSCFHLLIFIVISDVVPYLFIYPYISKYTSVYCMPVLWNNGQYLILLNILFIIISKNYNYKSFINSLLFSILSFYIFIYSFGKWFCARKYGYTNYFNDNISKIIFFFASMFQFIKDYSCQKILKKADINPLVLLFAVWFLEEIVYIILRFIWPTENFIFLGGIKAQNIFAILISIAQDVLNAFLLFFFSLPERGFSRAFSHIICIFFFIFINIIYFPVGYVLFSILASIVEVCGYFLCITLSPDEEFDEFYNEKPKTIEKNKKESFIINSYPNHPIHSDSYNINIDDLFKTQTPDSIDTPNNPNTPYNTPNHYNFEEKIAQLEEEKAMIESDKRSLENELNSLKNKNSSLTNENNQLKSKNEVLKEENENLISKIADKEIELENLKNS